MSDRNQTGVRSAELADEDESSEPFVYVWALVAVYVTIYVAFAEIANAFVLTDEMLDGEWLGEIGSDQYERLVESRERWRMAGYVAMPALLVVKMGFTSVCVAVGGALAFLDVRFRDLFRAAVQSEAVFVVAAAAHLAYCLWGGEITSAAEYVAAYPFSAANLVRLDAQNMWLAYLLKTMNAFEIAYIVTLTVVVRPTLRLPVGRTVILVAASYGCGMLLWVGAVTLALMTIM